MKRNICFLILFATSASLFAQGRIIIPDPPRELHPGNVYLKNVKAQVDIRESAGKITLEQSFFNSSDLTLEGEYLFPVPHEAQLYDFYLYINGVKTRGQLLEKQQARNTYEHIVRSLRDPALLEYSSYDLFKARIFPIEPKQDRKIEHTYAQVIQKENDMYRFSLPIRQSGQGSIESFRLTINLEAKITLANIYSPSHPITIERTGSRTAIIKIDEQNMESDKDFLLYYSVADQDINGSLLTFRPRTDKDGYFMFMASPDISIPSTKNIAKDVIFVIDISGSMGGEKIIQARDALRFCLNTLTKEDRFQIISFSSTINNFQTGLEYATSEQIKNATYFISNLSANGGTNINSALQRALQMKVKSDLRPTSIVFLTDGLPTEGVQDIGQILKNVQDTKKEFIRIFSFGVGYDVNTFLLDKLSNDSHGSSNYVKPGENIEKEVSTFFAKISSPVLTNPEIVFDDIQVYDMFPAKLPDLFRGQRVILFGCYRQAGQATITISGKQGNKVKRFSYKMNFSNRTDQNDFIAKLWASRKVNHLLTQIRFHGENDELVSSVKQLANDYGIVTPYTSYLVTEQQEEIQLAEQQVRRGNAPVRVLELKSRQDSRDKKNISDEESVGASVFYDALTAAPKNVSQSSGKGAVMSSRIMKKMAYSEKEQDMILTVKRVAGKTFRLKDGIWVDNEIVKKTEPDIILTFTGEEYFKFLKRYPELRPVFALGDRILLIWNKKIYSIQ